MADKPEADVVLSWFSSGASAASAFERPTKFVQLPTPDGQKYDQMLADIANSMGLSGQPLLAVLKKYANDVRPQRIALLGFSQGCQGVRSVLRCPDARRVDSVIAIDGIHAQFQPGSHTALNPGYLTAYSAFASLAADGARLMVNTTSAIVPPYPTVSTTDTAAWIWREATGSTEEHFDHQPPEGVVPMPFEPALVYQAGKSGVLVWPEVRYEFAPVRRYLNRGSLWILNYGNLDPTGHQDHVLQAEQIMPMVLRKFLAARWNQIAPADGICVLSAGDDDADTEPPPAGCFRSTRLTELFMSGQAEPEPLDIDPHPNATIPVISPQPELLLEHAPPAATPVSPVEEEGVTATHTIRWIGGLIAGAIVLEGARRIGDHIAKSPAKV